MAFQEKSAWVMSIALLIGGAGYFASVAWLSAQLGELAPPVLPFVVVYTVFLVLVAIAGHAVVAMFAPREASAPQDERDQRIVERAGHWSGYVLGAGIVTFLGLYLFSFDGRVMFYGIFACLMLSQLTEYILRITFYRWHG